MRGLFFGTLCSPRFVSLLASYLTLAGLELGFVLYPANCAAETRPRPSASIAQKQLLRNCKIFPFFLSETFTHQKPIRATPGRQIDY